MRVSRLLFTATVGLAALVLAGCSTESPGSAEQTPESMEELISKATCTGWNEIDVLPYTNAVSACSVPAHGIVFLLTFDDKKHRDLGLKHFRENGHESDICSVGTWWVACAWGQLDDKIIDSLEGELV